MAFNDTLRDLQIRHHVGIQRLSTQVVQEIMPLLDKSDAEIVSELQDRGATLEGTVTSQRLRYLLRAIREINQDAHVEMAQRLRGSLKDLARYEAGYQINLLDSQLPVALDLVTPSASTLDAIITSEPFGGSLLRDAVAGLRDAKFNRVRQAVQLGMIQGETVGQIVQRVRGTKARNYRDGVLETSRKSAERLVRTATNHVANAAREITFEQNADVVKEQQYVATLDTRTCMRCAVLDGKRFKVDDPKKPHLPLHLSCRCTWTGITFSWQELGISADEIPAGTRASMNGQVSATDTFNSWLRKQSAATQDEALGPTRGALFRRGKLNVQQFVDVRGNALTLDELAQREKSAFRKAGVAA